MGKADGNPNIRCTAGSHFSLQPESGALHQQNTHGEPTPDPSNLVRYGDWLNEEKYKERKDLVKFLLTLSAGILTFTVSFRKDIVGSSDPSGTIFLRGFWALLLASVVFGMIYYVLEYRCIFFLRLRRVNVSPPSSHHAGKAEDFLLALVVYLAPISFVSSLILLTAFVLANPTPPLEQESPKSAKQITVPVAPTATTPELEQDEAELRAQQGAARSSTAGTTLPGELHEMSER